MKNTGFGLPIAFAFVIFCGSTALAASPYSKAVQKACAADYHAHCSEYGLESAALRTCMDRNGRSLPDLRASFGRSRRGEPGRGGPAQEIGTLRPDIPPRAC